MTVLSHSAQHQGSGLVSTVSIQDLSHWYGTGATRRQVLQSVDLQIAAGEVVSGYPAIPNRRWLRCSAAFNKLPEMARTIRKLQK